MRVTRTVVILVLTFAAAACDAATPTAPGRGDATGTEARRKERVSPTSTGPRMGGNYIGSGH